MKIVQKLIQPPRPVQVKVGTTRDCLDPWTYLEVSASGDIRPCCNFPALGRLDPNCTDGHRVRNGDAFRDLRKSLLDGDLQAPCQKCHIRKTVATTKLRDRVRAEMQTQHTDDILLPMQISEIRVDINEKCNLRCDYCEVSSPTYAGIEMEESVFERVLPLLKNQSKSIVHVNGHGETTFHPRWVEWCRKIVETGHQPYLITNLAKNFTEDEVALLTEFGTIQVSLDSDDAELMRTVRKAVNIEKVFNTVQRIREAAMKRGVADFPIFGMSIGVYVPSIWTLERFIDRLIDLDIRHFTFWSLVEKPHQEQVSPLSQLEGEERERAGRVLRNVRARLDYAGLAYEFAGDFHSMLPKPRGPQLRRFIGAGVRRFRRIKQRLAASHSSS